MKTKFRKVFLFAFAAFALGAITMTSCKKEGPAGPAGADGTNGTNGTDGTDGYGVITTADQAAYDAADGKRGGILYDNWTATESGITGIPVEVTAKPEFFRCKSCHAWDGLGNKASYINRPGNANRPNVSSSNLRMYAESYNIKQIFDAIKYKGGRQKDANTSYSDVMPDYSVLLSDADIWDLVKYLKVEAVNTDLLYDYTTSGIYPTGTVTYSNIGKDGVAADGDTYYTSHCASCHGADGKLLPPVVIGNLGRTKPNEVWHKVKFGQLGSSMSGFTSITLQELKNLYVALQDTLTYPN